MRIDFSEISFSRELAFERDEVIKLIRRIDANWFEGEKADGSARGFVPCNYIEAHYYNLILIN